MNTHRLALACAGAALLAAGPVFAQNAPKATSALHTYQLSAENGSSETGTVTLAPAGKGSTTVTLSLNGAPTTAQPAHVHHGSCPKVGPVAYPLSNVMNGKSTTTIKAPLGELIGGGFAVNVHKSTTDLGTYVACADLGNGMSAMPAAGGKPMPGPSEGPMPTSSGPAMPAPSP